MERFADVARVGAGNPVADGNCGRVDLAVGYNGTRFGAHYVGRRHDLDWWLVRIAAVNEKNQSALCCADD